MGYSEAVTQREQASATDTDLLVAQEPQEGSEPMMTVTAFPTTDPRGAKAVKLALDAGQWAKVTTRDGRKFYAIKGSNDVYHLANRSSCTCQDFEHGRGRDCKHVLAVELHCRLMAEQAA